MNLCSIGHEEVCFEGDDCPACEIQIKTFALEDQIKELEDENNDLCGAINRLETEIEDYKRREGRNEI